MQGGEKMSLEQIRALLEASQEIRFAGHSRSDVYEWVGPTMREHDYAKQGREAKGLPRAYVGKMTGLSRAQETRLVARYLADGEVKETAYRRHVLWISVLMDLRLIDIQSASRYHRHHRRSR